MRARISSRQIDEELLEQLSAALRESRSLDYAREEAGKLVDVARKELLRLPAYPVREMLAETACLMLERVTSRTRNS